MELTWLVGIIRQDCWEWNKWETKLSKR